MLRYLSTYQITRSNRAPEGDDAPWAIKAFGVENCNIITMGVSMLFHRLNVTIIVSLILLREYTTLQDLFE